MATKQETGPPETVDNTQDEGAGGGSAAAETAETQVPSRSFRVLTLNTQLLPDGDIIPEPIRRLASPWLSRLRDAFSGRVTIAKLARQDDLVTLRITNSERRAEKIARRILEAGDHPDVVCLQEVFDGAARRRLIETLSPFLPFYAEPMETLLKPGSSGLMTFSRFPFATLPLCHAWRATGGTDRLAAKGLMISVLDLGCLCHDTPSYAVVTNVHLQSGDHADVRGVQLRELRQAIIDAEAQVDEARKEEKRRVVQAEVTSARPPGPVVTLNLVGGDFNIARSSSRAYRAIFEALGHATKSGAALDVATAEDPEKSDTHKEGRIDHWFTLRPSRATEPTLERPRVLDFRRLQLSDHDAVVTEVVFRWPQPPAPVEQAAPEAPEQPPRDAPQNRRGAAAAQVLLERRHGSDLRFGGLNQVMSFATKGLRDGRRDVAARALGPVDDTVQASLGAFAGAFDEARAKLGSRPIPLPDKHVARSMEELERNLRATPVRPQKPIGGCHAMSDVVDPGPDGARLDTRWLRRVQRVPDAEDQLRFESGATIDDLNHALGADSHLALRRALFAQPGYGGLTFVGTMSVGGHGSGHRFGALYDEVIALRVWRSASGPGGAEAGMRWYGWVEGEVGHEDIIVSHDFMKAALVGLGLVGVITEVILKTRAGFRIAEVRERTRWRHLRRELDDLLADDPKGDRRHSAEVWINPYDLDQCVVGHRWETTEEPLTVARRRVTLREPVSILAAQQVLLSRGHEGRMDLVGIKAAQRLALETVINPERVVMTAAEGLGFGAPNNFDALASSVAVPRSTVEQVVETIHETVLRLGEASHGGLHERLLASPIGIRFVRNTLSERRPWLAPQGSVVSDERYTAMVEMPTIARLAGGESVLDALVTTLVRDPRIRARPHWGQYLPRSFGAEDVASVYGQAVASFRPHVDPLLTNAFASRLGLADAPAPQPAR